MNFGVSSMVLPLKKVALLRPGASLLEADINKWHYSNIFNPDKVQAIYSNFVNLLTDEGVEIFTYPGTEISYKGAGGPTCLTRPFLRIK